MKTSIKTKITAGKYAFRTKQAISKAVRKHEKARLHKYVKAIG